MLDKHADRTAGSGAPDRAEGLEKVNSITIAFGHGVSTTPLQTAVGCAALMNGGYLIEPTFLPRSQEEAMAVAKQVVSEKTGEAMRYLYRLNAEKGSGKKRRGSGLPRRRQDRHGREGRQRPLLQRQALQRLRGGVPDGRSAIHRAVDHRRAEAGKARHGRDRRLECGADRRQHHPPRRASMLGVKPDFGHENERNAGFLSVILEGAPATARHFVRDDWNSMKLKDFAGILPVEEGQRPATSRSQGFRPIRAASGRASCSSRCAGTKADGAAYAADAAKRGARGNRRRQGRQAGRRSTVPVLCSRRSAAGAGAEPRRASSAGSPRRWSRSPAPAARPRSPPSPARSGSRPASRRRASARPAWSRPAATSMAR